VGTAVFDAPILLTRDEWPEDEWRRSCESEGKDPASDRVLVTAGVTRTPIGAAHVPPRPLVLLIAAYALADGDMAELVKTLHPNPQESDAQKLSRLLHTRKRGHGKDGLVRRAQQVATLVMGGKVGRGGAAARAAATRAQHRLPNNSSPRARLVVGPNMRGAGNKGVYERRRFSFGRPKLALARGVSS
jgi:H+/Cl- antiporter ClcA